MESAYQSLLLVLSLAFLMVSASPASADNTAIFNLTTDQAGVLMNTLAAGLSFRPLEPASAPVNWGISGGVTGTLTSTLGLAQQIPSVNTSVLPAANLYLGAQGPFGLGVEFGFMPNTTIKGFEFGSWGGDVKWNLNQLILKALPVDIALRGMYTHGDVSFTTTNQFGNGELDYSTSIFGFNLAASIPLWILEPYAGLGWAGNSSTLTGTANISLFNSTATTTNSLDSTGSSLWVYAGLQVKVLILTLTAEYDRIFDTSVYALKLGFKI